MTLRSKDKALLIPHLTAMNEILEDYADESLIDEASRKRVIKLSNAISF